MKVSFGTIWPRISGILMGKACQAMSPQDAEDLVSIYSVRVWQTTISKKDFKEVDHAQAYFIRKFKFKIIDYLRYRKRRNRLIEEYTQFHPTHTPHAIDGRMGLVDLREEARMQGDVHAQVIDLILQGYTYREVGIKLNLSYKTVGWYVSYIIRQMRHERRVVGTSREGGSGNNNEGGIQMPIVCQRKNNVVKVVKDGIVMARAILSNDCAEIKSIEIRKGSPIKSATVVSEVQDFLGIKKSPTGGSDMAAKKAPAKKAAKAEKKNVAMKPPRKPLDWDKVKVMPSTLEGLQKLVGGEGYCLGGSGQPVARRFKPGYDAKLKSVLKKRGDKASKALAKVLGWYQIIKWNG